MSAPASVQLRGADAPQSAARAARASHTATPLSQAAVLESVRDLPALPAALIDVIAMLGNEAASVDDLATCIARDQALVARTLRLANSPFYGRPRRVTSVADATAVLGLHTLRSVALAAGLVGSVRAPACAGFDFAAFWRHAIGAGLCAAALARPLGMEEGLAFTVGLLHDIGSLALASGFPDAYAEVLCLQRQADGPVQDAERALLGTDHAALGALIAEHWRFAPTVVEAIAGHHAPQGACLSNQAPQGTGSRSQAPPVRNTGASLADLVHVADNLAHALDLSGRDDDLVPPLSMAAWARLGLSDAQCVSAMAEAQAQHEAVCAAVLA